MDDTSGSKIGSAEKIWRDLLRRLTKKSTQHILNETVVSGPPLKPNTSTSLHPAVTSSGDIVGEGDELDDIGGGSGISGVGKGGGQHGNNSDGKESKDFHPIVYILGICVVTFFFYTQYVVQKEKEQQSTKGTTTKMSHVNGVVSPIYVQTREVTPKLIQMQPDVTHTEPVVLQQHVQAAVLPQNKYEVSKPPQAAIPVTESQSDTARPSSPTHQLVDIAHVQAEFDRHNDVREGNNEAVLKDQERVKAEFDKFYGIKK